MTADNPIFKPRFFAPPRVVPVGVEVENAPRIVIPYSIYRRIMGWMRSTGAEVSWRGLLDWDREGCTVTEVFLPRQLSTLGYVCVPTGAEGGDVARWLTECVKKGTYTNAQGECRYKWHMHKHPGSGWSALFESGKDMMNNSRMGHEVKDIDWMLVGRATRGGEFCTYLEVFKPYGVSVGPLNIFVNYKGHLFLVSEPNKQPELKVLPTTISADTFASIVSEKVYAKTTSIQGGTKITSFQTSSATDAIPCTVWETGGVVYMQLSVPVSSWKLHTVPIMCKVVIPLPGNEQEAAEVREKSSVFMGFVGLGREPKEVSIPLQESENSEGWWAVCLKLGRGLWTLWTRNKPKPGPQ